MKRMHIAMTALGALALGFVAVWSGTLRPTSAIDSVQTGQPVAKENTPPPPVEKSRPRTPLLESGQLMQEAILEDVEHKPSTLTQLNEAVLENDPRLAEFVRIREKSLRTKDEKQRYEAMLADPSRIQSAKELLLAATESSELSEEEEIERLHHLKFLTSAADWAGNPQRQAAFDAIAEIVLAELPADMSREQRGSLLGDKVDLYQHLLTGHAEHAKRLRQEATGTPNERVLLFAENMMKAPEETAYGTP